MKRHIQISYKERKLEGYKGDVCKECKWIQTTLLLMHAQVH